MISTTISSQGPAALHRLQGAEDRPQGAAAYLPVEILAEGLQVDLDGVQVRRHLPQGSGIDVAARYDDGPQAPGLRLPRRVHDVLELHGGLVVGEGDHRRRSAPGPRRQVRRRDAHRLDLLGPGLGDLPVLAEAAGETAPRRGHGVGQGPRQKMVERLFLDGVHVGRGDAGIDQALERPVAVFPDAAPSPLPRRDDALVGTEAALDRAPLDPNPVPSRYAELVARGREQPVEQPARRQQRPRGESAERGAPGTEELAAGNIFFGNQIYHEFSNSN